VRLKAKNTTGTSAYGGTASGTPLITAGLYDNILDVAHKIGNQNLTAALTYLSTNAETGHEYFIVLGASEIVAGSTLSYSGKTVGITLMGIGAERTISLGANGALFTIGTGVTLTLDDNITLSGRSSNKCSLVSVSGTLIMKDGSKITGNTFFYYSASSYGGGVFVNNGGTFNMEGGTISGNAASSTSSFSGGGGVYVSGGSFTMKGGTISGNTASSTSPSSYHSGSGGGVYIYGGTFIMDDGTISGNTASSSVGLSGGGGVFLESSGAFTMKGGTINGNTASSTISSSGSGGGVHVYDGTFIMEDGTISGNTSSCNTIACSYSS